MAAPAATSTHDMKYRFLGNSGLLVSQLSFGCMLTFDSDFDLAYDIMTTAFKNGVNFFDNAEGYGFGKAEAILGRVIQKGVAEGVWTREDLVLSTKIFVGTKQTPGPNDQGISRKHIIEGTKASLKRMQTDYVDVIFCHRPEGWSSHDIIEACDIADRLGLIRPIVEQPQYHIFERSRVEYDHVNLFKKYKLGLTTWSPLAYGVLTGKYSNGIPEGTRFTSEWFQNRVPDFEERVAKVAKLEPIAKELGCSVAQLAIAWCASNPNLSTVILGASRVKQLEENLKANLFVDKITPEVKARIDEIVQFVPKVPQNDMWYTLRSSKFS
ncbi:K+ channel protein [Globisporangium polare]